MCLYIHGDNLHDNNISSQQVMPYATLSQPNFPHVECPAVLRICSAQDATTFSCHLPPLFFFSLFTFLREQHFVTLESFQGGNTELKKDSWNRIQTIFPRQDVWDRIKF
jgi:hypothetical protein